MGSSHNLVGFHENDLKTSHTVLFTDKQTQTGDYSASVAEVVSLWLRKIADILTIAICSKLMVQ